MSPAAATDPSTDETPRSSRRRKPEWVRILEEDAEFDEDVARVLEGADGDEDKIRSNMRADMQDRKLLQTREGVEKPPQISFREVNLFALWIWLEFHNEPSESDVELLDSVMRAWFIVGKLGGFNTQNLQVYNGTDEDQSFFEYSNEEVDDSLTSYLHDVSASETRKRWARCRIDMGTCDELAVDVLLNMLVGYSRDHCGVRRIIVGGSNKDWPTPEVEEREEAGERGDYPKVGMNPMKLPSGMDEELAMLDELVANEQLQDQARGRGMGPQPEVGPATTSRANNRQTDPLDDLLNNGGRAFGTGAVGQQQQQQQQMPWGSSWAPAAAAAARGSGGAAAALRARRAQDQPQDMTTRIAKLDDEIEALLGDRDDGQGEGEDDDIVRSGRGKGRRRGGRQYKLDDFRRSIQERK